MSSTCDFCGTNLGFRKLRYKEGYVCKTCYAILSDQFKNTIRNKSKKELFEIYSRYTKESDVEIDTFDITKRVGNYLLIDERHRLVCVPNNRNIVGSGKRPKIYDLNKMKDIKIYSEPQFSNVELKEQIEKKAATIITKLSVSFQYDEKLKHINITNNTIRTGSFAFKKSYDFANKVYQELQDLIAHEK